MERQCYIQGVVLLMMAGYMCMPVFDEINCDKKYNCTDIEPVCGSDGETYLSKCDLNLEYQKRICEVGDFTPIAFVHEGNCTNDEG